MKLYTTSTTPNRYIGRLLAYSSRGAFALRKLLQCYPAESEYSPHQRPVLCYNMNLYHSPNTSVWAFRRPSTLLCAFYYLCHAHF